MNGMSSCKTAGTPLTIAHLLLRERIISTNKDRQDISAMLYESNFQSPIKLLFWNRPNVTKGCSWSRMLQANAISEDKRKSRCLFLILQWIFKL